KTIIRQQDTIFHRNLCTRLPLWSPQRILLGSGCLAGSCLVKIEEIRLRCEVVASLLTEQRLLVDVSFLKKNSFVHAVASPKTEVRCLPPGYTHNRVVVEARVAEVEFNQRFIIAELTSPYKSIGKCAFYDRKI